MSEQVDDDGAVDRTRYAGPGHVRHMVTMFSSLADPLNEAAPTRATPAARLPKSSTAPPDGFIANGNRSDNIMYNDEEVQKEVEPGKPASYLKLSCSVSGYSSYSRYNEKRATPQLLAVVGCGSSPEKLLSNGKLAAESVGIDETDKVATTTKLNSLQTDYLNSYSTTSIDNDAYNKNQDGHHFKQIMNKEHAQILALIAKSESYLSDEKIPDEGVGLVRAAVGKAQLLTTKKFKQFEDLCNKNLSQNEDEPYQTTNQDLAGFWDMVMLQIDDIGNMFKSIETARAESWQDHSFNVQGSLPVRSSKPVPTTNLTGKPVSATIPSVLKSSKVSDARHTARQKLLAAKRAGRRDKKILEAENEIEIFIA